MADTAVQTEVAEPFVCGRCGDCCIEVGRTFWKGGLIDEHIWDDCPELKAWANDDDYGDDGFLDCEMLDYDDDARAVCLIELVYGVAAKPVVCREHECGEDSGEAGKDK